MISKQDLNVYTVMLIASFLALLIGCVFAISLGTDDGLKEGHTVDVVRGGRHIGTAKVTMAKPNHATARFVDGMRNAPVQVDDKVTTTLSKRMNTAVSLVN